MRRWHSEEALMRRRQNFELAKHRNQTTGELDACHCLNGIGTVRKHRPNESCGGHCSLCAMQRNVKRLSRRKVRRIMKRLTDCVDYHPKFEECY